MSIFLFVDTRQACSCSKEMVQVYTEAAIADGKLQQMGIVPYHGTTKLFKPLLLFMESESEHFLNQNDQLRQ